MSVNLRSVFKVGKWKNIGWAKKLFADISTFKNLCLIRDIDGQKIVFVPFSRKRDFPKKKKSL